MKLLTLNQIDVTRKKKMILLCGRVFYFHLI